jgi:hypothetical protein
MMMGRPKKVVKPEEEEKEDGFPPVDKALDLSISQLAGVGKVTEGKLIDFGVTSLFDICVRGSKELSSITGVTPKSMSFPSVTFPTPANCDIDKSNALSTGGKPSSFSSSSGLTTFLGLPIIITSMTSLYYKNHYQTFPLSVQSRWLPQLGHIK